MPLPLWFQELVVICLLCLLARAFVRFISFCFLALLAHYTHTHTHTSSTLPPPIDPLALSTQRHFPPPSIHPASHSSERKQAIFNILPAFLPLQKIRNTQEQRKTKKRRKQQPFTQPKPCFRKMNPFAHAHHTWNKKKKRRDAVLVVGLEK